MAKILPNLNRFSFFFHWKFHRKICSSDLLKIPPLIAHAVTIPRETLTSENKRLTIDYTS